MSMMGTLTSCRTRNTTIPTYRIYGACILLCIITPATLSQQKQIQSVLLSLDYYLSSPPPPPPPPPPPLYNHNHDAACSFRHSQIF
jgi:hypothetical protein